MLDLIIQYSVAWAVWADAPHRDHGAEMVSYRPWVRLPVLGSTRLDLGLDPSLVGRCLAGVRELVVGEEACLALATCGIQTLMISLRPE